jgi:hypothetical protein
MDNDLLMEEYLNKIVTQRVVKCTKVQKYEIHYEFEDGSVYEMTMTCFEELIVNKIK